MRLEDLPPRFREQAERQLRGFPRQVPALRKAPVQSSVEEPTPDDDSEITEKANAPGVKKPRKRRPIMDVKSIECESEPDEADPAKTVFKFYLNPLLIPTAQQKGIDFKHELVYTQSFVKHTEKLFLDALRGHVWRTAPIRDAKLRVHARFFFPYPQGFPKSQKTGMDYCVGRGDGDNYWKGTGDSFSRAGVWTDDRQIVDLRVEKFYTDARPRVEVEVSAAEDPGTLFAMLANGNEQETRKTNTQTEKEPLKSDAPRTTAAAFQSEHSRSSADGMRTV